ncbi:MAG: DMT family transporter [Alphaproteobacteria bacterium]
MTRLNADLLLFLATLLWGTTFIAQKLALPYVGPYTYVAARFFISMLLLFPLTLREYPKIAAFRKSVSLRDLFWLCVTFSGGVILQQVGIGGTSVTNAAFLTGFSVVLVPMICIFIYGERVSHWVFPAALLSLFGIFLLTGAHLAAITSGDWFVLACAIVFAFHIALVGRIMMKTPAPFCICLMQFSAVFSVSFILALLFEDISLNDLHRAALPILYAGVLSGGVAYTIQVVVQRYTPASDAGVIMCTEAVFAAIAGALILGERLAPIAYLGCAVMGLAILLLELGPHLVRYFKK